MKTPLLFILYRYYKRHFRNFICHYFHHGDDALSATSTLVIAQYVRSNASLLLLDYRAPKFVEALNQSSP